MSDESLKSMILRSTVLYTVVSFTSRIMAFPKSIVIGLVLMPEEFGLYNSIFIWFHYLTIVNIGLCSAAGRESAHYFGQKGKEQTGIEIQNKAISIDFFIVLFVAICFIIYSLRKQSAFLISCYVLVAITYLLNQISSYYERFNSARNLFTGVAKANLLRNTLSPVLIIITVYHLKIYALFVIPVFALLVKVLYYRIKMPLNARLTFNYTGVGPLLYCGFFLGITSMLSTFYFVIDRTFIKLYLDDTIMGLYSFSLMFVVMMQTLFANFMGIFVDTLNKNSANLDLGVLTQKGMVYVKYLLLFAVAIVITAQLCYYVLVNYFLTNYEESATIFIIFSTMIFFYAMFVIPNSLLYSRLMEREKSLTLIMVSAVVSGIIFNALFVYLGWKGEGIALATVLSQVVMTAGVLFIFMKHTALNIKLLIEMSPLTLLFIAYSGYFYYMAVNNYPIGNFIACFLLGVVVLWVITQFFHKINPFHIAMDLFKKPLKFAG